MGLEKELGDRIATILSQSWKPRDGNVVPDTDDIALDNDAVKLEATVLYADMVGSSDLVQRYPAYFSTEMYKCFLYCAARIIKAYGGEITAYDGDRIMAVFAHKVKNSAAAFCALKINYAVKKIINPAVANRYKGQSFFDEKPYAINHVVGIDTSTLWISKTGIRGANDLVWVGRAANFAASLSAYRYESYSSFLTSDVYGALMDEAKKYNGNDIWTPLTYSGRAIYASRWTWELDLTTPAD